MKFNMFKKTDQRILLVAAILFLTSSGLLWQDTWIYRLVQIRDADLEQIGDVTSAKNDVRRRFEIALSWLPLTKNVEVYQGDSIFTGSDSTVVIKTKTGEEITIAPNSLVVITQHKDSVAVNIGFGSVEGRVDKGKKLLISSNNSLTELNGDNARVKIDAGEGNKLLLNVIAGEVNVKSSTGEKVLKTQETALVSASGDMPEATRQNITLLSPLIEQRFKSRDDIPVIFSWKTSRKFSRMKIKISLNRNFKDSLIDSRVDDMSYSAYNLPKDVPLYWQIIAEGGASTIASFALVGDRPPIPVSPKPGYQFFYSEERDGQFAGHVVDLQWERGSISDQFDVQLARSPDMKIGLVEHKTNKTTLALGTLQTGIYYWRVRSREFSNERWSEISSFKVGPEPSRLLSAPVPVVSENTILLPTKIPSLPASELTKLSKRGMLKYIASFPELRWSGVSGADRYEIQVAKTKSFKNEVFTDTATQSHIGWRSPEPGKFYWRVKAEGDKFKDGIFTHTQEIFVQVEPPHNLAKTLFVDEVPDQILLHAAPPPLDIAWNPTVFSDFYEVEFSATSDFADATKFITTTTSRKVQIPTPGVYFWRVRALDRFKTPISPFSVSYTLEFQRVYKDPALIRNLIGLNPRQQDSIILVGRDKSELEFRWTNAYKEKHVAYRLELSYEPNFDFVFFSDVTNENYYTYKAPFTSRVVYWRVRAESKEFTSDWTGANRFLISYETDPFDLDKSDVMFEARKRAQERQNDLMAANRRRIAQLRSPASTVDLQLDTPQITTTFSDVVLESNMNTQLTPLQMTTQPFSQFFEQVKNYPTLRWEKVQAAERYVIEIARDPEFTKIVTKAPTWEPFYVWDLARPGSYYYRVQAFNERYTHSAHSHIQPMRVMIDSPVATSPDQFVEVFADPKEMWPPPKPFTLSWTPAVFSRGYEVQFSEDQTFQHAKIFRTIENKKEFAVSKPGLYYWRVRPINENGINIGQYSSMRSVEIVQSNRTPASTSNLTGLFPLNRTMLFVGQGLMNLAFHWVIPSGASPTTTIELSTSENFSSIIAHSTGKGGKLVITQDLPEGKIFWRARTGSQVSAVYDFILRREREAYVPNEPVGQPPTTKNKLTQSNREAR
jgi:hypothetical protein